MCIRDRDASRTFFAKYLEYERRVERANLGGAVKYQLVSMSHLVDTPVQKMLGRRFSNRGSITQQQLETAIEAHAGHEEAEDDSQGCLPEREADARLAEVPPRQRVAVDTPCKRAASGACDPRSAGTTSEPRVREVVSPAQTTEAGTSVNLQQWFGGGVPLDDGLRGTMRVPGEVGLKEQGATVREEMPLDGWRKVGVPGMLCLKSGLEFYRTGIT